MAFTIKPFDQILGDIVAWTIAHSPDITDMTPGSVIRSYCEGAALSIEELYVSAYLGFIRYLNNIQETVFDFARKDGTRATANVVFTRDINTGSTVIPTGTRLKTPSGLRFLTTADVTIGAGAYNSSAVEAEAEAVGITYNVSATSITVLEDQITNVISVTNALAATGGVDIETDAAYKKRFQAWVEGLGRTNISGLSAGALGVPGITSVSIVELFPPVANVNVDLYIDDGSSGGVSTALVNLVQETINGDGTEDNPGYRAAGVNVVVKKPAVVSQNVTATVSVLSGVDSSQVDTDLNQAITNYINTLGAGSDIIYNEIVAAIMSVYGVTDCALTIPAANVTVGATQVGRVGTIAITQV